MLLPAHLVIITGAHASTTDSALTSLRCVCEQQGRKIFTDKTLKECSCPFGKALAENLIQSMQGQKYAQMTAQRWLDLLKPLTIELGESLLILDEQATRSLLSGTRSLCSCAGSDLWSGSCGFSSEWRLIFKILLAVGWSEEQIRAYYAHQLQVKPEETVYHQRSSGFIFGIVLIGLLGLIMVIVVFRKWHHKTPETKAGQEQAIGESARRRLIEELDKIE